MLSASTEVGSGIVSADFNAFGSFAADFLKSKMEARNKTSRLFMIKKGEKLFFVITQELGFMTAKLKMYEIDQNEFFRGVRPVRSVE